MIYRYVLLARAVGFFGRQSQILKSIEEMAELTKVLAKDINSFVARPVKEQIIDEIADVCIMAEQLKIIYGVDEVDARIEIKLDRLQERMDSLNETMDVRL